MILLPFLLAVFVGLSILTLVILIFVFWIKTLIEVLTMEPSTGNDKIVWLLVVIFFHLIGAVLYHFIRRPERIKLYGK
jgi:hypothetical protein